MRKAMGEQPEQEHGESIGGKVSGGGTPPAGNGVLGSSGAETFNGGLFRSHSERDQDRCSLHPPEQRGLGYARACVAGLSQQLLDRGFKYCFLFTDLRNPTSNHIYQQIGYRQVSDVNTYYFR